jgi:hypothetical protein
VADCRCVLLSSTISITLNTVDSESGRIFPFRRKRNGHPITTAVDQLVLAADFGIDSWCSGAYMRICTQEDWLSLDDCRRLGADVVWGIGQARQALRPATIVASDDFLHQTVASVFGLLPQVTHVSAPSATDGSAAAAEAASPDSLVAHSLLNAPSGDTPNTQASFTAIPGAKVPAIGYETLSCVIPALDSSTSGALSAVCATKATTASLAISADSALAANDAHDDADAAKSVAEAVELRECISSVRVHTKVYTHRTTLTGASLTPKGKQS